MEIAVCGPLIVNDFPSAMDAASANVGLAQLPEPLVAPAIREGRLEEVLGQYAPSSDGVFIYYPSRTQVMPKLRAFIDHARKNLPWLTPTDKDTYPTEGSV
jgi:DNA-binding transcriptional LysR family regulator